MSGIIGNADSAKFIFIACEDEGRIPTGAEMNIYFPNHQMNVYKAWGHFKWSFAAIQTYIQITRMGIKSHTRYGQVPNSISHAIRLNAETPRNSFFDLKYQGMLIESLHLSHHSFVELEEMVKGVNALNQEIENVLHCYEALEKAKVVATKLNLADPKVLEPDQQAIDKLFNNYGERAQDQLYQRLKDWRKTVMWE